MKSKNICKFITQSAPDRLEVHQFIYETDFNIISSKSTLSFHRAILIRQGSGKIEIDGSVFDFKPGDLIMCFENECICFHAENNCEYFYIDFGGTRAEALFHRFCINRINRVFGGFDGLIPMWHDGLLRASNTNLDLVSEGILLYTFSRLVISGNAQSNIIEKILEITEENFTSPDLSVAFLAQELSYNAKYISHIFKQNMGISYSEHLRTLRIKYAVSLLEHGIDSVKNIAFLSGFTDPLYFSTVFKNTVGVSPKEYKKRFLNMDNQK